MTRSHALCVAVLTGLALGGCSHVHLPYLPHDGPFRTAAETAEVGTDTRVDPVQTGRPVVVGTTPPCKFGGARCPPWERAWPANHGVAPADKVTDTGEVKRAAPAS